MAEERILIVDDEPDMLMLASIRLKKFGYNVITAANGKDALDIMRNEKPELVLLDLVLPVMSGAAVCKEAKKDEALKHIPIILFSVDNDIMTSEKAKRLGAESYIAKPFDIRKLKRKIAEVVAKRK